MLHNWISVTMFFNFYFLISKLYLLCERMLITIRDYIFFTSIDRLFGQYVSFKAERKMWPGHPREHPSRQKLEKRFSLRVFRMSLIQFLLWNSGMHRRQWRYIHVSQIPIAKILLLNTIDHILLRLCMFSVSLDVSKSYIQHQEYPSDILQLASRYFWSRKESKNDNLTKCQELEVKMPV